MLSYPDLHLAIDGDHIRDGRETLPVLNPATGREIARLPIATEADVARALATAERAFRLWSATPAEERAAVLRRTGALLRERSAQIAAIATMEQGKTIAEATAEVAMAAASFEWAAEEARRIYGRMLVRPSGRRSIVTREPVGPIAAFAPWNFPIDNPARKFSAPLAAGCSVILKPAEESPASALAVLSALADAGLPAGVAQILFGVPDRISRQLIASPVIRQVSLTGSVVVGKALMRLAADGMKRTTFELGGHAPVLIFDDADLDRAVTMTATSKYRNAGQVCISPTRFYVQAGVYDRFVDMFAQRASAMVVGDGADPATNMGPMANARRLPAMERLIDDAMRHGARLVTGGVRGNGEGFFWRPTVLADVPRGAAIMNEEPFGPIAAMARFESFDEAITEANRLPYGLAAYAFTQSADRALALGPALEAGMVGINTTMVAGADSPFGGVKESGHGSEEGPEGVESCLITKAIHQG
ncbi:NAD-dependent succinate-semialdehyde dehydrogenase [Sphingomonas sp.]|uniref:NAD-dependent succinate-semialdehyde dehydrogenase n=1 Tax=Sphingomonas sp. TaxID=28214 RepID=UPI000DB34DCA|nr:NAD-dependent succinate-semialdehyde dehydrogenase [Sphingomonas sp.]PZU10955.1 MAG: NAD-dependent succinate-semialdehyde dehydrogenase [Sphingomonas sp.]